MQVYKSVTQLRSPEFKLTGLFSTEEVFAFTRVTEEDGNGFIVVMNVMKEEVKVSLMDLILEVNILFNGEVLVRSSGDIQNPVF